MGKRKRAHKKTGISHNQKKQFPSRQYVVIAVILLLAGTGGGIYAWRQNARQEELLPPDPFEKPARATGLPATPRQPRPITLPPEQFSNEAARAYQIAQEVPELLEQMPCYCDCYQGNGHQNNFDCYVDSHAST